MDSGSPEWACRGDKPAPGEKDRGPREREGSRRSGLKPDPETCSVPDQETHVVKFKTNPRWFSAEEKKGERS